MHIHESADFLGPIAKVWARLKEPNMGYVAPGAVTPGSREGHWPEPRGSFGEWPLQELWPLVAGPSVTQWGVLGRLSLTLCQSPLLPVPPGVEPTTSQTAAACAGPPHTVAGAVGRRQGEGQADGSHVPTWRGRLSARAIVWREERWCAEGIPRNWKMSRAGEKMFTVHTAGNGQAGHP